MVEKILKEGSENLGREKEMYCGSFNVYQLQSHYQDRKGQFYRMYTKIMEHEIAKREVKE